MREKNLTKVCLREVHFKFIENKKVKNICCANSKHRKADMTILILDKISQEKKHHKDIT